MMRKAYDKLNIIFLYKCFKKRWKNFKYLIKKEYNLDESNNIRKKYIIFSIIIIIEIN